MLQTVNPDELTLAIVTKWFEADLRPVPSNSVAGAEHGTSYTVGSHVRTGGKGSQAEAEMSAYAVNQLFYDGEHWQGGAQWAGQWPLDAQGNPDATGMAEVGRAFVSQNLIRSVQARHTAGVAGREAFARVLDENATQDEQADDAQMADDPEEEAADPVAELNATMAEWLERRNLRELLQSYSNMLGLAGTAPGRLFIPTGQLAKREGATRQGGQRTELKPGDPITVPTMPFEEALSLVRIEVAVPGKSGVYEDPWTGDKYAAHTFSIGGKQYAEVSYLDADGNTKRVLLTNDGGKPREVQNPMDLGGALLIYQRHREPLITEQVRQQQRLVNKAFTMMNTNLDWSGFVERIITNSQRPEKEVPDGKGGTKKIPVYEAGAGTATFLNGFKYEDENGNVKVTTPQVIFREPIGAEVFTQAIEAGRYAILDETNQLHALISGDASPSGESRIQARADFITSLLLTKPALDGFGRWLMETAYRMACDLSGTEPVDSYRMVFRCRLDPGPASPEETRAIIERVKANLLSRRSALALHGVEDVDAELAVLSAEMLHSGEMADRVASWIDAGLNGLAAMVAAGIDEDTAREMLSMDMVAETSRGNQNPPPNPPNPDDDDTDDDE